MLDLIIFFHVSHKIFVLWVRDKWSNILHCLNQMLYHRLYCCPLGNTEMRLDRFYIHQFTKSTWFLIHFNLKVLYECLNIHQFAKWSLSKYYVIAPQNTLKRCLLSILIFASQWIQWTLDISRKPLQQNSEMTSHISPKAEIYGVSFVIS